MNNEELHDTELTDVGAAAPKPVADLEPTTEDVEVTPLPDVNEVTETVDEADSETQDKAPVVTDFLPSIKRENADDITIDDNFNFIYVLKNGKQLKTSVKKPSLQISTELSDKEVKFTNDDLGNQMMMANNAEVYAIIMNQLIRGILVDDKPISGATFANFTKIGMTKGELDDYMNIINTFYLS